MFQKKIDYFTPKIFAVDIVCFLIISTFSSLADFV